MLFCSAVKDLYNDSLELFHAQHAALRSRHFLIFSILMLQLAETFTVYPKIWELEVPRSYQATTIFMLSVMFGFGVYIMLILNLESQVSYFYFVAIAILSLCVIACCNW